MAAKKTARKAPKKAAKKTAKKSVAKSAKRSSAKKSTARKAVKKTAKKSAKRSSKKSATYRVPPVPVSGSSRSSVSTISTTPKPATSSYSSSKKSSANSGSSNKIMFAVILGIVILAVAVIAKGASDDEATTVTPTPVASESATPTESASPTASNTSAALAAHEAPTKIVAQYTSTGATVFWKSPVTATEGITGYNLELRTGNTGEWKLVATVPATQFSQDITKTDTTGWAQVKVSTVYSDGVVVDGKIFGLPGSWS